MIVSILRCGAHPYQEVSLRETGYKYYYIKNILPDLPVMTTKKKERLLNHSLQTQYCDKVDGEMSR